MDYYDHIEDYCENLLSPEDKKAFEAALLTDSQLKTLVDQYPDGHKISEGLLEMDMMETLARLKKEKSTLIVPITKKKPWIKWVAAACVVGVLVFIGNNLIFKTKDTQKLYSELYQEAIWPIERGQEKDMLSSAASMFLKKRDIVSAKRLLQDSLENKTLAHFWIAEMYLAEGNIDSTLLYLPDNTDLPQEKDRITYIKMLVALKSGDLELAKETSKLLPERTYNIVGPKLN